MNAQQNHPNPYNLSPREIEVLIVFCDGLNYIEIGKQLFISERTVQTHINNCYEKFSIPSRQVLLFKKAVEAGYYKL